MANVWVTEPVKLRLKRDVAELKGGIDLAAGSDRTVMSMWSGHVCINTVSLNRDFTVRTSLDSEDILFAISKK